MVPEIESEYQRFLGLVEAEAFSPTLAPYLDVRDVLKAHFLIAEHFYLEGAGLGGLGPRDINLLHSAVGRQQTSFGGQSKWTDKFDISATVFYGLIKNHPFYDANKRTAFLSTLFLLTRLGYCPTVDEKEFEDLTVLIADNGLEKFNRFKDLVKSKSEDPEIKFISWYLRNNTRVIDKQNYAITFNDLQRILSSYGFALDDPRGNYIDIVKIQRKKTLLGFGKEVEHKIRLGQIGFPRWTAEVSKSAIKTVREVTDLTHKEGVDSSAFFRGLDPMRSLLTTYNEPLKRLADR